MQLTIPKIDAHVEQRFDALADQWERETRHLSSPSAIARHPACQKIIEMGGVAIPLILLRMKHRPWFWFDALTTLAKEPTNPVDPSMFGDLQKMTDAWLEWGVGRGYIT